MKTQDLAKNFEQEFNRKNFSGGVKDMRVEVEDKSRIRVTFLDRDDEEVGHAFVDTFGRTDVEGALPYNVRYQFNKTVADLFPNRDEEA